MNTTTATHSGEPLCLESVPESNEGVGPVGGIARSQRILIVEDDAQGRDTLGLLFRLWGYQVQAVGDGLQGLEVGLAWRPAVAVLDIGLPGLDGHEVARSLRAELGENVFLIALTGRAHPDDYRRSKEAGFNAHLVKPVDPEHLRDLLPRGTGPEETPDPS
jgi:CheY-like chemotaxis protein